MSQSVTDYGRLWSDLGPIKMIIKEAGKSNEPGEKKEEEGDVEDKSQVTQVRV